MKPRNSFFDIILPWRNPPEEERANGIGDAKKEPFIELPLQAYKVRRNMLLCGILCAAQGAGAVRSGVPKVFGMNIELSVFSLNVCLLLVTLYFTIYFIALAWEVADKWRLRKTGVPDSYRNATYRGVEGPSAKIISQSTAWETIEYGTRGLFAAFDAVKRKDINLERGLPGQVNEAKKDFMGAVKNNIEIIQDQLNKFEDTFWESQSKRRKFFVLLEFHGPIFLCCAAMLWLFVIILKEVELHMPSISLLIL